MMRKISVTIIVRSAGLNKWNGRFILRGDSGFGAAEYADMMCRRSMPIGCAGAETGGRDRQRSRKKRQAGKR